MLNNFCNISSFFRSYRNNIRSRSHLAAKSNPYPRVKIDFAVTGSNLYSNPADIPMELDTGSPDDGYLKMYYTPEEEISMAPACWLWDYLRLARNFILMFPNNISKIFVFQTFLPRRFFSTSEWRD